MDEVGRSKSGSLTGWIDQFVGLWRDLADGRGGVDRCVGSWRDLAGAGVRLAGAWNDVGGSV